MLIMWISSHRRNGISLCFEKFELLFETAWDELRVIKYKRTALRHHCKNILFKDGSYFLKQSAVFPFNLEEFDIETNVCCIRLDELSSASFRYLV